jgi:hypothetical protein
VANKAPAGERQFIFRIDGEDIKRRVSIGYPGAVISVAAKKTNAGTVTVGEGRSLSQVTRKSGIRFSEEEVGRHRQR